MVDEPGPDVLYMRLAVTDLYLQKERRGVWAYTPAGAVVQLGADQVRDMMSKVDIIEMALQAELLDSQLKRCCWPPCSNAVPARTKEPGRSWCGWISMISGGCAGVRRAAYLPPRQRQEAGVAVDRLSE